MKMKTEAIVFVVILNQIIKNYIQSGRDRKNFQEIKCSVIPNFQCPIQYKSCSK